MAAIPILREKFGLDTWHLVALFLVTGVSAVAAMQVSGRLADRFGARRVCLGFIFPMMVAAVGYALVGTYPLLLATGVFLGAGNGGIDVAMNALGVQVEGGRLAGGKRPIMSFFHGTWALGSFAGSLAISMVGTVVGLSANTTLMVVGLSAAVVGVGIWILAWIITPETVRVDHERGGKKTPIPAAAWLMGLMAIGFALGEGTGADWSGAHVRDVAGVDPRIATWAVTVLMAYIALIRLFADRLVAKFGRRPVVRAGAILAACGYAITAVFTPLPLLLVGWALVGLGTGVIAPQVYATAGHLAGGRGLAVVVTFGYTTFLAGPAFIGGIIHLVGIHRAMAIPALLLLGVSALVGVAMKDR
jgi:MFS family permease